MARWEFKLPDIGEGVNEGEIVAWRVAAGDRVEEDQAIVEVMTDKATVTITAPRAGTVVETRGRVGEIVAVHSVLVVFELDAAAHAEVSARSAGASPTPSKADETRAGAAHANGATAGARDLPAVAAGLAAAPASEAALAADRDAARGRVSAPASEAALASYYNDKPLATPATRKLARDMNVDLREVRPSGPQGRVTRRDVQSFGEAAVPKPRAPDEAHGVAFGTPAGQSPEVFERMPEDLEQRIPFTGLRRRIAHKMELAAAKTASFTFVEECDVTNLKAMRERLVDEARAHGAKLSFLPFILKAVVAALKKHPMLNAVLDEQAREIVLRKYYNIGIATATQAGLMVPVVKDADKRSIVDIAREVERLAEEARTGKARLEDLQGSTFTVTSLGARGGLFATPIVNFPEVAILGVHQMKQRPVVKNGQIAIGDVMLLSLSFDHRVVDGHVGAAFAYDVIGYLEQPERLLLEMA